MESKIRELSLVTSDLQNALTTLINQSNSDQNATNQRIESFTSATTEIKQVRHSYFHFVEKARYLKQPDYLPIALPTIELGGVPDSILFNPKSTCNVTKFHPSRYKS